MNNGVWRETSAVFNSRRLHCKYPESFSFNRPKNRHWTGKPPGAGHLSMSRTGKSQHGESAMLTT